MNRRHIAARFVAVKNRLALMTFAVVARGDAVECLLCGWHGRRFFGGERCPVCRSLPRNRLIPYALAHFGLQGAGLTILHVGPNRGEADYVRSRLTPRLYLGVDLFRPRWITLCADLEHLPVASASVDGSIAWHVLEHVPDDRGAVAELYRVTRPEGWVLLSVPIHPPGRAQTYDDPSVAAADRLRAFGHRDHVRACGLDYGDRFADGGFAIDRFDVWNIAGTPDLDRYGLATRHVVWRATKER